jgi:hypothetical protein
MPFFSVCKHNLGVKKTYPTKTAIEDGSHSTLAESPTKDKKVRKKKNMSKTRLF